MEAWPAEPEVELFEPDGGRAGRELLSWDRGIGGSSPPQRGEPDWGEARINEVGPLTRAEHWGFPALSAREEVQIEQFVTGRSYFVPQDYHRFFGPGVLYRTVTALVYPLVAACLMRECTSVCNIACLEHFVAPTLLLPVGAVDYSWDRGGVRHFVGEVLSGEMHTGYHSRGLLELPAAALVAVYRGLQGVGGVRRSFFLEVGAFGDGVLHLVVVVSELLGLNGYSIRVLPHAFICNVRTSLGFYMFRLPLSLHDEADGLERVSSEMPAILAGLSTLRTQDPVQNYFDVCTLIRQRF